MHVHMCMLSVLYACVEANMHECADARLTSSICHSPPYLCMYIFIDRVSFYISDWLGTHREEPFASDSQVLVLKMYGTIPGILTWSLGFSLNLNLSD